MIGMDETELKEFDNENDLDYIDEVEKEKEERYWLCLHCGDMKTNSEMMGDLMKDERKTKGKGGLIECPICKSDDMTYDEIEYATCDEIIQRVSCNACSAQFTESWKPMNWEMVKQ